MPKQRPIREFTASAGMTRALADQALAKVSRLGFGQSVLKPIGDDLFTVVVKSNRDIDPPEFLPELFHLNRP